MIENDFIFDGESLSSHGYVIASFGNTDENSVASNMNYATIKAPLSDVSRLIGTGYEENYTRTISIIKDNCKVENSNLNLTNDDISEMTKWLCRKEYKWFRWESTEIEQDEVWYEAMFTVNNIEFGDEVVGLELTIQTNRPYGLTRIMKNTWNTSDEPEKVIAIYTDEEGYIYPNITLVLNAGKDLKILNRYDHRTTVIKNCEAGETITIYGEDTLQIESDNEKHDLAKDFNYVFPRLCSKYRNKTNTFSVNLDADITFTYRGIRKVGL